jgi:hypothetical protein
VVVVSFVVSVDVSVPPTAVLGLFESVGAVLFSVLDGAGALALLGIVLLVSAGVACELDVSVDCATAAPIPASSAAAAATADNFF